MDPVSQIFAQQQSGSAGGEGFGQFAVAGMQAGLARRRLALEEKQESRLQARQTTLMPFELELAKQQAANLGATAAFNKAKFDVQTQQNMAMPELMDLQVRFMQAPDGFSNPALIAEAQALSRRYPAAFVPGAPGNELMTQVLAVPMLESRWQRALSRAREVPAGMSISLPEGGQVSVAAERAGETGMQSTVGKLVNDYRSLLNSGDTEGAQFAKAALIKAGQADGLSIEFDERGMPVIKQGAAAGATSGKVPQSVVADAMATAGSVGNLLQFGREIVQLAKPGNVGVGGNLKRLYAEVVGQFLPVEAGDEFDYAQAVTFFRAGATRILRSDSQITNDERKSIIADLPSKGFSESDETARRKAEDAMKRVAASAKRQLRQAGLPLPADLLTIEDREEIAKQVREGMLSMEQAKQALMRKEVF